MSVPAGRARWRVFFALWPGRATRDALAEAAVKATHAARAQLVKPTNLHVTLAFLGGIETAQLPVLRAIAGRSRGAGGSLQFARSEYWANARVLVAVADSVAESLRSFRRELCAQLAENGCMPPPDPWRPHVTLATKLAESPPAMVFPPITWHAREFALVRSDTSGARPVYTVVDTWPLLDE